MGGPNSSLIFGVDPSHGPLRFQETFPMFLACVTFETLGYEAKHLLLSAAQTIKAMLHDAIFLATGLATFVARPVARKISRKDFRG